MWSVLYPDIKKHIISFLSLQELGRMCQTSKDMKDTIYKDNVRAKRYIETHAIDCSLSNLFTKCCANGSPLSVIEYLVSNNFVDPSRFDNEAIKLSSLFGHHEIVKFLLTDHRVDPSDTDDYAIRVSSRCGHYDVIKSLLSDPRVDPSSKNNCVLRYAIKNANLGIVKLLLVYYFSYFFSWCCS
jgi:hypothetical protein